MEDRELKYGECIHFENLAQCAVCNNTGIPDIKPTIIEDLLSLLALHKGSIVSTASLPPEFINQARASGRLYVDDNSLGYVWEPDIKRFPETEEEVEFFKKWYPLKYPLPEKLKDASFLYKK